VIYTPVCNLLDFMASQAEIPSRRTIFFVAVKIAKAVQAALRIYKPAVRLNWPAPGTVRLQQII